MVVHSGALMYTGDMRAHAEKPDRQVVRALQTWSSAWAHDDIEEKRHAERSATQCL